MSREEADQQVQRLAEGRLLCQGCLSERPVWQFRRISVQGPAVPRHWSRECFACESLESQGLREGTDDLRGFPSAVARARRAAHRAGAQVHRITAREIRDSWSWINRNEVIGVDLVDPAEGFQLHNLEPITRSQLEPEDEDVTNYSLYGGGIMNSA